MALDMANGDASCAAVSLHGKRFGLVLSCGTDSTCSSSARTSAIHKEKFNVP